MKHSIHSRLTERQTGSSFTPKPDKHSLTQHVNTHTHTQTLKTFSILNFFNNVRVNSAECKQNFERINITGVLSSVSFNWLTCHGWGWRCSLASSRDSLDTNLGKDQLLLPEDPSGRSQWNRYSWSGRRRGKSHTFEGSQDDKQDINFFFPFLFCLNLNKRVRRY